MSGKTVAVLLKPLIDLHGEPRNWATAAPLYIKALSDIPPELLAVAVDAAIAGNPYFPKPADLRSSIADELASYYRRREEARLAALPMPEPIPPPTAEEIAHVDRLVAQALRGLRGRVARHRRPPSNRIDAPISAEEYAQGRKSVADELAGFRLADPDDPRVQARLREMGGA
jgi:hypothetical protein